MECTISEEIAQVVRRFDTAWSSSGTCDIVAEGEVGVVVHENLNLSEKELTRQKNIYTRV